MIAACPYPRPLRYDRDDPAHQDWLAWWLDRMMVRFSELDQVGDRMHGRAPADMERIVGEVKRRRTDDEDPEEFVSPVHKRIKRSSRAVFISQPRQAGKATGLAHLKANIDDERRKQSMAKKIERAGAPRRVHEPTGAHPAQPGKDVAKQPPPWDNDDIPAPLDFWVEVGPEPRDK